jgi:hypothetical protein
MVSPPFPHKKVVGKYRFQMRVVFGFGFGEVLGASYMAYQIQNIPGGETRSYEVDSVELGASPIPVAVSGPSSWSEFSADCYVNEFVGNIWVAGVQVADSGMGYGVARISWMDGPAEGTVCLSKGWLTGIAPGASVARGYMTGGLTPLPVHHVRFRGI